MAPTANIKSMKGETSGSRIWKMKILGRATQPKAPLRANAARCFCARCCASTKDGSADDFSRKRRASERTVGNSNKSVMEIPIFRFSCRLVCTSVHVAQRIDHRPFSTALT